MGRLKRQTGMEEGISFDWWARVGTDSERYRSTVYGGISNILYRENAFNNPINLYELVAGKTNG